MSSAAAQQQIWFLKLVEPQGRNAFYLRFSVLVSRNGFRQLAETSAVLFERVEGREVTKIAAKQTFDIQRFRQTGRVSAEIGPCRFSETETSGQVQSKGRAISWNLAFRPAQSHSPFVLMPVELVRSGALGGMAETLQESLLFTGEVEIDGVRYEWKDAPGMLSYFGGSRSSHSWTWSHCNQLADEQGRPSDFVFEGMSSRPRIWGPIPGPRLSCFYFFYQQKEYRLNTLWNSLRMHSQPAPLGWEFRADTGDLSFRGQIKAQYRDFAGLTYEDTNGALIYCSNSELSDLDVQVYRRGKLESSLRARGTAAYEHAARAKSHYIPLLL
jgi:hypothetical protein